MTSKKKVLLCSKCMIFSRRSKIWEQHILKSLEKKKLWNNYWPVDTKKKLYFFVGQNFFFSVAWPSALRATEKKNFDQQKKNFFLDQRSEIVPKLLSFPTIKDLYNHKFFGKKLIFLKGFTVVFDQKNTNSRKYLIKINKLLYVN